MTIQDDNSVTSHETRNMWIAVAVILAILLGGMGINMLVHHDAGVDPPQATD
jgi:hypothetical protein